MYLVWYKPLKLFSSVQLEKKRLHMALLFISQFAKLHFGMVDVQKVYLPKFVLNNSLVFRVLYFQEKALYGELELSSYLYFLLKCCFKKFKPF